MDKGNLCLVETPGQHAWEGKRDREQKGESLGTEPRGWARGRGLQKDQAQTTLACNFHPKVQALPVMRFLPQILVGLQFP